MATHRSQYRSPLQRTPRGRPLGKWTAEQLRQGEFVFPYEDGSVISEEISRNKILKSVQNKPYLYV